MAQNFVPANTNAIKLKNWQCEIAFSLSIQVGEFMVTRPNFVPGDTNEIETKGLGVTEFTPRQNFSISVGQQKGRGGARPAAASRIGCRLLCWAA